MKTVKTKLRKSGRMYKRARIPRLAVLKVVKLKIDMKLIQVRLVHTSKWHLRIPSRVL